MSIRLPPENPSGDHGRDFWRASAMALETEPMLDMPGVLSDHEFRMMADNLPVPCWIARHDGAVVWYNRRWYDYCGGGEADMIGWGWTKSHDPDVLPNVRSHWAESIDTGEPFEMVFPLRGADGAYRPFLTRVTPLRNPDGRIVRWFGINTEIGPQLQAEMMRDEAQATYVALTNAMPHIVWGTRADGAADYFNQRWFDFTGTSPDDSGGDRWNAALHPDDRERTMRMWRASVETGKPYDIEYRLRHRDGDYRWVLARALPVRDPRNTIIRWIGTCTDIHEARAIAEQNSILSRELSHRIKNIFAVINGLIGLSSRQAPEAADYAADLSNRVLALARAHEFARPHHEDARLGRAPSTLVNLIELLTEPYQGLHRRTFRVSGDDVVLDEQAATPIGLLIHELATNAAKYGALSAEEGHVDIAIADVGGGNVTIRWRETGGPQIGEPPNSFGFGTRLADMSVRNQLGGSIEREWLADGLLLTITVPAQRLRRRVPVPV